jgi:protein O-GlcNAc transferase
MSTSLQGRLREGLTLHQRGEWSAARAVYEEILGVEPRHFEALHLLGVMAAQRGDAARALGLFDQALGVDPRHAVAHFNRGATLEELSRFEEALASYARAVGLKPQYTEAHFNRGLVQLRLGRWEGALESFDRAIAQGPPDAAAHSSRGHAHRKLKRWEAALADYDRAIELEPTAHAYFSRALVHKGRRQWAAAVQDYDRAIELEPGYAEAYCNRALMQKQLGQLEAALGNSERAIALKPQMAEAYCSRGAVLQELGRSAAALADYDRAIELKPDHAEAHSNRGNLLRERAELEAALGSCERAIALDAHSAEAHCNRGVVLQELERPEAALESFDRAIAIDPCFAPAYFNRGNVLEAEGEREAALASYDKAIAVEPSADAYCNRGNVQKSLGQWAAALASYDEAIAMRPGFAGAHGNRGNVLMQLKQLAAAIDSYDRALALDPDLKFLRGERRFARMQLCDWTGLQADLSEIQARLDRGEAASSPFPLLALVDDPPLHRKAAQLWMRDKCPANPALGPLPPRPRHEKIRIGYFSADFRNHPVSLLTAELFETHDRSRFEVSAYSFGPDTQDEMRLRLQKAFDRFIDVRTLSDRDIALLARRMELDIAIDLGGFTGECRPGIFALRAAPLQLSYLGYLGTLAADYMDYLIADPLIVPASLRPHYAEKILYLPSYQANDSKRYIAEKPFSREELGLPARGFVFCCFNANYKFTPDTFSLWMRILEQVQGSVLFLYADSPAVAANLQLEARRRGVDPHRLIFGERLPMAQYLARYRAADLFLDTLPYNAGTTASDALWAGLPVLTCTGQSFASRVAASLLSALALPELITHSPEHYESLAVALATDPPRLAHLRQRLASQRLAAPLFNTPLFTRRLEAAYSHIYQRCLDQRPTEHIELDS